MTAVIRVKRRIDEEPFDAFVLNCKKRRLEDTISYDAASTSNKSKTNLFQNATETSTVMKFVGTVPNENDISTHISRLTTKSDAETAARKERKPMPISKSRAQARVDSHENRYKVVNCYRTLENGGATNEPDVTVVDIVKQNTQEKTNEQSTSDMPNETNSVTESSDNFVFDLYLPDQVDQIEFDSNIVDNLIRFVITGHVRIYGTMI